MHIVSMSQESSGIVRKHPYLCFDSQTTLVSCFEEVSRLLLELPGLFESYLRVVGVSIFFSLFCESKGISELYTTYHPQASRNIVSSSLLRFDP